MKGMPIESNSLDLTMLSAQAAYKENDPKQAEEILLNFLEKEKGFSNPYLLLSRIFVVSNKSPEAIKILETALLTVKERWEIHFELARILLSENKYDEAKKKKKIAASLHPSKITTSLYLHISVYMHRNYIALITLLLLIISFVFIKTFGIWVLALTDISILTLAVLSYIVQSKSYSFLLAGMCIFLNIIYLLFFFRG